MMYYGGFTVVFSLLLTVILPNHGEFFEDFTLCEDDDRPDCYTPVATPMDQPSARQHCNRLYRGGYLAITDSQLEQNFLALQATSRQWEQVWVDGALAGRRLWHWYSHDIGFAYQGCFVDVPVDPDLPVDVTAANVTSPSACISTCEAGGYHLAGIQQISQPYKTGRESSVVVCHCSPSFEFGRHGISHDAACSTRCPSRASSEDKNFLNIRCGGENRQLVFLVSGERFHSWSVEDRRGDGNCAFISFNPVRRWKSANCHARKGYLCHHVLLTEEECDWRQNHQWASGMCIEVIEKRKSWYEAVASCAVAPDIFLAYIRDSSVVPELLYLLDEDVDYWIDLTFRQWIWHDNFTFQYFNWARGQPTDDPSLGCVSLKQPNYKWANIGCARKLPFFCVKGETHTDGFAPVSKPTTTALPGGGLSNTAVLGIGIGAGAAFVLSLTILAYVCYVHRRAKTRDKTAEGATAENAPEVGTEDSLKLALKKERSLPALPLEALPKPRPGIADPNSESASGHVSRGPVDSGDYDLPIEPNDPAQYTVPFRVPSERTYEPLHDYLEIIQG